MRKLFWKLLRLQKLTRQIDRQTDRQRESIFKQKTFEMRMERNIKKKREGKRPHPRDRHRPASVRLAPVGHESSKHMTSAEDLEFQQVKGFWIGP